MTSLIFTDPCRTPTAEDFPCLCSVESRTFHLGEGGRNRRLSDQRKRKLQYCSMRRSSEQIKDEFTRLYDCFEVIVDCLYGPDGPLQEPEFLRGVVSQEEMLGWVADKKSTYSGILAGAREGLNDISLGIVDLMRRQPEMADEVLLKYRERTGRDFWVDAGHPKGMAKEVLKRGVIENETEWRMLNGFLCDLDPDFLSAKDQELGERMIAAYGGP